MNKYIPFIILPLFLSACSTQKPLMKNDSLSVQVPVTQTLISKPKEMRYDPNVKPTKSEQNESNRLMIVYYDGLTKSIKTLDDGVSSADVISNAALGQNYKEYQDWLAAKLHHFRRTKPGADVLVDARLNRPIITKYRDEAVSLVLRHRNGTLHSN